MFFILLYHSAATSNFLMIYQRKRNPQIVDCLDRKFALQTKGKTFVFQNKLINDNKRILIGAKYVNKNRLVLRTLNKFHTSIIRIERKKKPSKSLSIITTLPKNRIHIFIKDHFLVINFFSSLVIQKTMMGVRTFDFNCDFSIGRPTSPSLRRDRRQTSRT